MYTRHCGVCIISRERSLTAHQVLTLYTSLISNNHSKHPEQKTVNVSIVIIIMFSFQFQIYTYLTPIEILSCLLAAMCHDLDHPGVNQTYLVNTSSYLATIHGVRKS